MISPCKECQTRSIGCHGKCDMYRSWSLKHQRSQWAITEARRADRIKEGRPLIIRRPREIKDED